MAATRSRVGSPQAFLMLPYPCLDYLPNTHPNKSAPDNGSVRAFDIGKEIPEPFRCRECLPIPPVRPRPCLAVAVTNQHPTTSRRVNMARRNAPPENTPSHTISARAFMPSAVIAHTCCSTPALEIRVAPVAVM
jgi:hypothetical protein